MVTPKLLQRMVKGLYSLNCKERGFHRPRQPIGAREDYIARINNTTWYVGEMARKESTFATRAFEQADRYNDEAFQAMLSTGLALASQAQIKTLC